MWPGLPNMVIKSVLLDMLPISGNDVTYWRVLSIISDAMTHEIRNTCRRASVSRLSLSGDGR